MAKRLFLLSCFLLVSLIGVGSNLKLQIVDYSISGPRKYINTPDSIELSHITLNPQSGLLEIWGNNGIGDIYKRSYSVIERFSNNTEGNLSITKYKVKLISSEGGINYLGDLIFSFNKEDLTWSFEITIMNDKEYYLTKLRK